MYLQYIKLQFNRTFEVEPGEGPVCEYDRVTVYSGSGGRHFVGECKKTGLTGVQIYIYSAHGRFLHKTLPASGVFINTSTSCKVKRKVYFLQLFYTLYNHPSR